MGTTMPGHGEDDVAVNGLEHLFAQPFSPEQGALLLARGAERSAATRVWDQVAQAARPTPGAGEAPAEQPAIEVGFQLLAGVLGDAHHDRTIADRPVERLEVIPHHLV